VNYRQISRGALYRLELHGDGEEFEMAVKARVIANDTPTLMRCAVDGLGLVSHLESVVRPWIERGEVRTVLDEYSVGTPGLFLCFPARAQELAKLRAVIEYGVCARGERQPSAQISRSDDSQAAAEVERGDESPLATVTSQARSITSEGLELRRAA
jgi:DNA-binding transcriptional LysR family regulator